MSEVVPVNPNFHEVYYSEHYTKWLNSKSERYNDYRRKWSENPAGYIDEGFPLNLDIDVTSACNLRCPMCMRNSKAGKENPLFRKPKHFDFDLYKRLIDEASELGIYAVKLLWVGEPLVYPRIVDMIKYAKDKGIEDVILTSNAVLLTGKMSRELISAGLDKLYFSFDAPYKEAYEKIRVGAKFDEVLQNIKNLNEMRAEMNSLSPTTRAAMVLLPGHESSFEDYKALFSNIVDIVAYLDHIDYNKDYYMAEGYKGKQFSCSQLWHRLHIRVDGEVCVCCNDYDASCDIGKIKDMTIIEAWNHDKLVEIRKSHREMRWYDINICRHCPIVSFSSSGSV